LSFDTAHFSLNYPVESQWFNQFFFNWMSRKIDLSVNDGDRGEKGTYRLIKELAF
jgi:hypothetical protein